MEEKLKSQIVKILRYMYDRRLISICAGNISARKPERETFWITPSGVFKPEVKDEELIKCDLKGNTLEGDLKPSSETPMHIAVYRVRPEVNAIIHAHTPLSVGLSLAEVNIKAITPEAAILFGEAEVPILPFRMSGTEALADQVKRHIETHDVLILGNHGAIAVGKNLKEAYSRIEALEETAMMMKAARTFGKRSFKIPKKIKNGKEEKNGNSTQ